MCIKDYDNKMAISPAKEVILEIQASLDVCKNLDSITIEFNWFAELVNVHLTNKPLLDDDM